MIEESLHQQNGRAASLQPACPAASPEDAIRQLLRRLAGQVLAEASALTLPSRPVSVTAGDDALTLTILAAPTADKSGRVLTPCERDVLAVLEVSIVRLSTSRMIAEMNRRGLLHGDSTVSRALIRLTKLGVICSSRRAPRGYYLPGKSYPLFPEVQV